MPKSNRPTVTEILALKTKCQDRYLKLQEQIIDDQKYYELDFRSLLNLPKEFEWQGVVLPTARDMVDSCVDHTDINNARVFVNRKGQSIRSEEEVEMMRKFYLGLIHRTNVESTISPWRIGAKHYWLHGMTVFKTVWDADRWPDKPEQEKGQSDEDYAALIDRWRKETHKSIPIVIQAVHPHSIMLDPYGEGGQFVFEVRKELVLDVQNKFKLWTNPLSKAVTGEVEHISFWTPEYRCELYDGEPVLRTKDGVVDHRYGFIPYVAIDTGLGNQSYDNDPAMRYVGILRYIKDILISESRDYSIADIILAKTAWPWGTIEGPGAEGVTSLDQKFGTYTPLPKDVKIVPQVAQIPPQALQQHLTITSGYISAHAAPNSVRGMGESGVRSGTDRRQLIAEASTRYQYSAEAFKNGTAKVLSNCALLMKNVIPGDIRVWARTPTDEFDVEIQKDKMSEPFTCYVEFAPISEEDEYRRHDDLERLVQSGIVTRKWARSKMSNVDPLDMEQQEQVQKILDDPAFHQIVVQYATAKALEALTARNEVESKDNPPPAPTFAEGAAPTNQPGQPTQPGTGSAPREMIPGVPNVPQPGSAQAIQGELKGMRSTVPMFPGKGRGINAGGNK